MTLLLTVARCEKKVLECELFDKKVLKLVYDVGSPSLTPRATTTLTGTKMI